MTLGERIRKIRKMKGLSILDIKEKTGLSKSTISDLENGKSSPTTETLQKIAKALEVDVTEFFKTEESNNQDDYEDFDLRIIERARRKMSPKDREKMMKILKASFEDFFNEEDGSDE